MSLIENIKKSEGYRGDAYDDSLGIPTIGYGTKLPLTKDEAEMLLEMRLVVFKVNLLTKKPIIKELTNERQDVLYEMAYQMGVNGVLNFKMMWSAIENKDYYIASLEMLYSKWAQQTPERAKKLSNIMRG